MVRDKENIKYCEIHTSKALFKNGNCFTCYQNNWVANNKDKVAKNTRAMKERSRPRVNGLRLIRKYEIKFGLSREDAEKLFLSRGNFCAICCGDNDGKALHLDHCHKTNVVRDFLCQKCNNALGLFKDDPGLLRVAADYLEQHRKKNDDI